MIVDSLGLVLNVVVSEANMPERLGAMAALLDIPDDIAQLVVLWVDQGFSGPNFAKRSFVK